MAAIGEGEPGGGESLADVAEVAAEEERVLKIGIGLFRVYLSDVRSR